jgi:hypothetical protein
MFKYRGKQRRNSRDKEKKIKNERKKIGESYERFSTHEHDVELLYPLFFATTYAIQKWKFSWSRCALKPFEY